MKQTRKLVTMMLSLLAAILLWLYVVTSVAPESTFKITSIPINIDGEYVLKERGLIITNQNADTLALELKTSRVNRSKLNANTIRVDLDVSKIREAGTYPLTGEVIFPDTIRSGDVEIIGKNYDIVTITVSELKQKSVPVELDLTGNVTEGYLFDKENVIKDPVEVLVSGPDYEIDQIARAVVSYDISELRETKIEKNLHIFFLDEQGKELRFSNLTTINISTASLTLPVYRTKEIKLRVELQAGGGVGVKNALVSIDPPTLRVQGSENVIDSLGDTFTLGSIDLSVIADHEERIFPLTLPVGVTNSGGETEAKVRIDLEGVSSGNIQISDIRLINVPEGYQAEASTRTVNVNVRGGTEEIEEVQQKKDNGIYILVDLADISQTGALTVSGSVVNPDHPAISIGSSVEISVIISPKEPTPVPEG